MKKNIDNNMKKKKTKKQKQENKNKNKTKQQLGKAQGGQII